MSEIVRRAEEFRELMSGSRLFEEELVEQFNISRSPIREALKILEHDGLVLIEPRQGARVRNYINDLNEVYATLVALESLAAAQAAEHCGEFEKKDCTEDLRSS